MATDKQKAQLAKDKADLWRGKEGSYKDLIKIYKRNLRWLSQLPDNKAKEDFEDEIATLALVEEKDMSLEDYNVRLKDIQAHCDQLVEYIHTQGYEIDDFNKLKGKI